MRGVFKAGHKADKIEELVSARLERQEILHREDPPWLTVLMDESVIHRVVSSRDVRRRQLEHLLSATEEPATTIRIVPDGASVFPSGAFNLLEVPGESDVAYVEAVGGHGQLIESISQVRLIQLTMATSGRMKRMSTISFLVCLPASISWLVRGERLRVVMGLVSCCRP